MPQELPAPGFPVSGDAVHTWFVDRYGREPSAAELTELLNAMAARDATPPVRGT